MTDIIRRAFEIERLASDKPNVYDVMIMTGSTVRSWPPSLAVPDGGVLENFEKNPVVMWAHQYRDPPVGRCLELAVEPSQGIRASFEFTPQGQYEFADTIHRLWESKFLNAVSIGFLPISTHAEKREGQTIDVYDKWELLEFSIVPIPADRDALRLMVRGLDNEDARAVAAVTNAITEPKAVDLAQVLEFLKTLKEVYHV